MRSVVLKAALLLVLALGLVGCTGAQAERRYFSYLDTPHTLAVTGKLDGQEFRATLAYGARAAGQGESLAAPPDFTLTYLAPEALAGVCVTHTAAADEFTVAYQGQVLYTDSTGLADVAEALLCESAVQSSRQQRTADGGKTLVIQTQSAVLLTLDESTGLPLSLQTAANGRAIDVKLSEWRE